MSPLRMVGTRVSVYSHGDTCIQLCAQRTHTAECSQATESRVETVAKSVCWFDVHGVCL